MRRPGGWPSIEVDKDEESEIKIICFLLLWNCECDYWPSIEGDDDEEEPLSVERRPADEESDNKDNWKGRLEKPTLSNKNNRNGFI